MSDRRAVHTVPHRGGWANLREGAARVAKQFRTKADARAAGARTARRTRVEHLIHKANGRIGQRTSYGRDPYPPRG